MARAVYSSAKVSSLACELISLSGLICVVILSDSSFGRRVVCFGRPNGSIHRRQVSMTGALERILCLPVCLYRCTFHRCLRSNLVKSRTVIMASHHIALLAPLTAFIVRLDKNGQVISAGESGEELAQEEENEKEENPVRAFRYHIAYRCLTFRTFRCLVDSKSRKMKICLSRVRWFKRKKSAWEQSHGLLSFVFLFCLFLLWIEQSKLKQRSVLVIRWNSLEEWASGRWPYSLLESWRMKCSMCVCVSFPALSLLLFTHFEIYRVFLRIG